MPLNPQIPTKLTDQKFSSISKLIAYEAFLKQKNERKLIESQRKNIELNVAQLCRQAKRASKELNKTQAALIQHLNRKSSKQEQERLKQQLRRQKEQQLNQQRNNNSLSRYMNMLKREQAKRRLNEQKIQISLYIKEREKHDKTLKHIKLVEQSRINFQKNIALENNLKLGVQLAKAKNLFQKKCLSSAVRKEQLETQNARIQKEIQAIQQLAEKKNELKDLFSRAQQQSHKYKTILQVGKSKPFIQMYELMAAKQGFRPEKERKKKKTSKKRKFQSESRIVSSYLGGYTDQ